MGVLDNLSGQQLANLKAFNLSAMQGSNNTAGLTATLQTQPSMLGIGSNPATPQQFFNLEPSAGGSWLKNLNGKYNNWAGGESFLGGGISNGTLVNAGMGIAQMGVNMLAGQNHSAVGDIMQTVGGLASNIPGVGGLIGAGVGVVGGLINAAFGSNINEEFVSQTKGQANALGSRVFNANTNADLLNDWQSMITQSNVSKSEVGSDGWFSNDASRETRRLNERINEANKRQLANFDIAAQNVDDMNDLRILQNMAAYGGPINSFRKYYADGGLFNTPQFFTFEPQTYDKGGYLNQAKALIRQNEGWSAKPYSDSPKGKNWRSVGYGFNDSGFRDKYPEGISKHYEHGITKKQAEEELDYFLNKAEKRLKSIYGKQWNDFSDSQKAAILDTYYQRPASVDKSSRFYKAVTAGEDAGRYLGVAGYNKRNSIRQNVFSGGKSTGQEYSMNDDSENTLTYPSPILEATSPIVDYSEAFAGVTPTQAKALELNFAAPNMDFLVSLGQPTRQAQTAPTVGTVEDFLASYGDFEENLFEKGGNLYGGGGGIFGIMPMVHLYKGGGRKLEYHPEGDYYYGGIPFKVTVTGKNKKKPYWVSPKGAGNTALTVGDLSKAYTAATAGLLPNPISAGINLSQGKVLNALEDMWLYNSAHSEDPNVNYGVVGFSAPEGSLFSSMSKAAKATPKQWTAAQDAAIARGDMAEAQRLRDLHFKISAPKTEVVDINGNPQLVVHKTPETFTVFDNNRSIGKLNWFATPNAYGENGVFATGAGKNPRTMKLYVNMRNAHKPTIDEGIEPAYINQGEDGILGIVDKDMTNYFKSSHDAGEGFMMSGGVDNPNALKSADAITYDNNGVRIPLGKRDNFNINDIRYAIAPFLIGGAAYGLSNEKAEGGSIHIAPSKRGTFTAAASKHGLGGNLFEDGDKLNIKNMNIFDFGGGITHGVNWDTGVDYVAEGQSHEQNPYGGVMVGQDEEGTPNLVEEGEYIWNGDYVFSRRMKVPKKLREKYKLPEDATFADAVKVLTKESEERPNDEISRATQDHILGELADSQEELRAAKAQRAMDKQIQLQDDFLMGMQFGLGGGLFADGGGIHIDPSKKGTFKAQASKMGMGVQEAASHILANKENYSPAMVKKAVFAHSFAHADGGNLFTNPFAYGGELGNVFAGEGDKPNSLMYTVDDRSLARRLLGDNGFTRFMENTAEAVNDPIGYFAGDEIEAIMNKVAQMSEPQLQRFFSTGIGQAVADAIVKASDNNGGKQYQEAGMQRWVKATGRMAKPIQKAVVESAKRALAQSKQIARSQMKTPKGGGSQKVLNETMTPTQGAKKAITGSTEGLPQGWNFTKGNTSTVTNTSGVTGRLNSKSPTGRAAQSRGTAPDPFEGLEGTMSFGRRTPFEAAAERWGGTPTDWKEMSLLGGASAITLPFIANYISDKVHDAMSEESPQTYSTVQPASATSNKRNENGAGNNSQSSKSATKSGSPLSGMMLNGDILGVNDPVTNAVINALPSELGSKKSKGTEGSKAGNTKAAAPVSTVPADYNWEQEAPWLFGNVAAPTPQERPMEQIARDKSTPTRSVSVTNNGTNFGVTPTPQAVTRSGITDTTSGAVDGITRSPFKPKQTWTRYAPLAMNALFGLKEMLTPADYTNANAITDAAYQVGTPVSIGTEYIGDYRKRDPFDESYLMNIINQNSRAANRNFMNTSGGNRAVAMSGILANDLITQRSLAEAARQAYLANRADDAQVAEFNRGTNIFNAQAQNQRNQYLAGLNSQRQNAMLSGISQGARLRQAIKDQRDAAISANLSTFAQELGDLGRENGFYNMLGGLNDEGILKYFYGDDWNTKFNG